MSGCKLIGIVEIITFQGMSARNAQASQLSESDTAECCNLHNYASRVQNMPDYRLSEY